MPPSRPNSSDADTAFSDAAAAVPNNSSPPATPTASGNLSVDLAGTSHPLWEGLYALAGGVLFGLVSPIVGHPFDTVKTQMQAESANQTRSSRRSSALATVRQIYGREGVRGFYRGFLPPLLGSALYRGVQFSAFGAVFAACERAGRAPSDASSPPSPLLSSLNQPLPHTGGLRPSVLLGGAAAGACRTLIESPLDYVKVRSQTGSSGGGAGDWRLVDPRDPSTLRPAALWRQVRRLYTGAVPTLLRSVGLTGTFFSLADYAGRYAPDLMGEPVLGPFLRGGVCATMAWSVAFPFETVKSLVQSDRVGRFKGRSVPSVAREIVRERGVTGLWRGFGPGGMRSVVANGVGLVVYSTFQKNIDRHE